MINKLKDYIKSRLSKIYSEVLEKSCVTFDKPIFIWGTGRCGSYLLYDILSLHPDVCSLSTKTRWKKGLWGSLHYGDSTPEKLKGYSIPVEGIGSIWMAGNLPDKFYGSSHLELLSSLNKAVILRNYARLKQVSRFKRCEKLFRILDKSPTYIMIADIINEFFPDSYHIFCLRDPRAVVNSILRLMRFTARETSGKAYGDGFYAHIYPDGYEEYLSKPLVETLCWQIEQLINIGLNYSSVLGDRLILFRYEEILFDVYKAIPKLCEKVSLSGYAEILRFLPDQFPNYDPVWPKIDSFKASKEIAFDSNELRYFEGLHVLAQELGYARYEIGKIVDDLIVRSN